MIGDMHDYRYNMIMQEILMSDLISIILPVFNVEKYLEKCIISILQQDYSNLEIIFVDDGSTDNSGKILDKYQLIDSRIKVIHKENNGVSSARNDGIKISTGKYICFSDSDDYLSKDYVSYLYKLLVENDADISLTTHMFGNFNEKQNDDSSTRIISGEKAVESILCYKIPIGVYCKLFKSELIKDHVKFNEELFIGEGFNFNVTVFQNSNRIVTSSRKIYYYRRDNSNSATTLFKKNKCINGLYALDVMKGNFKINSERINKAWKFAKWRTYSDVYDMIVLGNAKKEVKELYRECKKYIKKYAFYSFKVPVSTSQRVRALVMKFTPSLIPLAIKMRRRIYGVKISKEAK